MQRPISFAALALACAGVAGTAEGHGFAGKRFFPATLATDDPFVADELSLPTFSQRKLAAGDDGPAAEQAAASIDFTKRITEDLGIGLEATQLRLRDDSGAVRKGFDNLGASVKYRFYQSDEREAIVSVGADWDIGNTGARSIGAESFSTITPAIFFGKGLGELPEGLRYLRPLAVTGLAGVSIPTRASTTTVDDDGNPSVERHPHRLALGFAVEYSIPYLQSFVKDVGLREPFNRLIPLIEVSLEKAIDRGASGFTGTVNPGVAWVGRKMQLGLEAVIPINRRSGSGTGVLMQVHFFLDDLFPRGMGRPVF